jgi:heme/copper-type cytochrome/quinol oxidase subunit 2
MANENSTNGEPRHLRRMTTIWLIISIVVDILFWILVAPHMAPGRLTSTAKSDQFDFNFLALIALPVLIGVWVFMGYSIRTWSAKREGVPEPVGGEAARGNMKAQVSWIVITTVVVLFLAGFGTVALISDHGSGG